MNETQAILWLIGSIFLAGGIGHNIGTSIGCLVFGILILLMALIDIKKEKRRK